MIEEKLKKLSSRNIKEKKDFESFLEEFFQIFDEYFTLGQKAFINWTRWTNKKEYEEEFKKFIREVEPLYKEYSFLIFKKIKNSGFFEELNEIMRKIIDTKLKIFRRENIEIEKKEEEFEMEYGKLNSEFVFEFDGKKLTLSEIESKLESENREIREKAFKTIYEKIYEKREKLHFIMDNLIKLRNQKAKNADFENYRDMRWTELLRLDYKPEDTEKYRRGVKKYILPLYEEYLEYLREKLQIKELKPWDTYASFFKKGERKLFEKEKEFLNLGLEVASLIDPYFAEVLDTLEKFKRLDLMARENKEQGGYMTHTEDVKLPFIFMNASGKLEDFLTLMHELGHSVNYMLSKHISNPFLRMPSSEFAEVGSISMEFFALEELKNKLPEDIYRDLFVRYFSLILKRLLHIGKIDGFQHFLYLNPEANEKERDFYFIELDKSLSPSNVKWDNFETLRNVIWYKQIHIFKYPFYYIDYGIALIGALNLWKIYRRDKKRAIEFYKKGMSLGGTKKLPELFKETGIEFGLDENSISKVSEYLKEILNSIKKDAPLLFP